MPSIGIYCSASEHIRPIFREKAVELGEWMGQKQYTLVNGGSSQGLMLLFSKTVQASGGNSIGVVPRSFKEKGWFSYSNDSLIFVDNLSNRKEVMKEKSDVLLVFPGGVGTMDEFFDAWASFNLGFHHKKIILFNLDGFYQPLLDLLEHMRSEQFLHDFLPNPLLVVDNMESCKQALENLLTEKTA